MSFSSLLPISDAIIKSQINTADGSGGFIMTWVTKVAVYNCRIYSAVGMVQITASGQNVLTTHKCIGEYIAGITEGDILIHGDNTYRIVLNDITYDKSAIHHFEMKLKKENIDLG